MTLGGLAQAPAAGAATIEVATMRIGEQDVKYLGARGRDGFDDHFTVFQAGSIVKFSAYFAEEDFQEDAELPVGCKRAIIGGAYGRQVDCDMTKVETGIEALALFGLGGADTMRASDDPESEAIRYPMIVAGGDGDDVLSAGSGPIDLVFGDDGDDAVTETPGVDLLSGGEGDDAFVSRWNDAGDTFDGGPGIDRATFARARSFRVSLNSQADDGVEGENDNVLVENLAVQGGGATFTGDDGPNVFEADVHGGEKLGNRFEGAGGDDVLRGGTGTDELLGGDGDDELVGGDDGDLLDGGPGRDAYAGDASPARGDDVPGPDTIRARDGVAETIGCGGAADTVEADAGDTVDPACEVVDRPAPPPPSSPPPVAKAALGPGGIGLRAPRRDRRAPFVFVVGGRLDAPAGRCTGAVVSLAVRRRARTVLRTAARVREDCTWRRKLKLGGRRGTYRLRARFRGGDLLAASTASRTVRLRAG